MRLLRLALFALLPIIGAAPTLAAEKTISVSGPGCDYRIKFDPAKVDERKLKDTANVILGEGLANPNFAVHDKSQIYTEALARADYENCMAPAKPLRAQTYLDMPGLADLRARRLEQIAETCAFDRIKGRALVAGASARILLEFQPAAQACTRLIEKADDPAALRPVWRELVKKRCIDNGNPAQCRKNGLALEGTKDADRLIRADVISHDWSNCAIAFLKLNVDQAKDDAVRADLAKRFRKTFRTKEICEDG